MYNNWHFFWDPTPCVPVHAPSHAMPLLCLFFPFFSRKKFLFCTMSDTDIATTASGAAETVPRRAGELKKGKRTRRHQIVAIAFPFFSSFFSAV